MNDYSKNKKVAKVFESYDNAHLGTTFYCAQELFENGCVSPFVIGKIVFHRITKEGLDEIVKDAMDKGFDEVVIDDKVKKELGL